MRAVLALFEGVVTGAADGYGRMTDTPGRDASAHGPGFGNGIANLHNAGGPTRRSSTSLASTPPITQRFDAPLQSDLVALARTVSKWVRECSSSADLSADATDAVAAAMGGARRVRPPW